MKLDQDPDYEKDVAEIIAEVRRDYDDHVAAVAVADRDLQAARAARIGRERLAIRHWLASWMPIPLIQFVQLDDNTYTDASSYRYDGGGKGTRLVLDVPGAVPVAFSMYRNSDEELEFGRFAQYQDAECVFAVPVLPRVQRDEEGDLYIHYDWPYHPQHNNFSFALGRALSLWQEWFPAILDKWIRMETERECEGEDLPEVKRQTWQEKLTEAIAEAIAEA